MNEHQIAEERKEQYRLKCSLLMIVHYPEDENKVSGPSSVIAPVLIDWDQFSTEMALDHII